MPRLKLVKRFGLWFEYYERPCLCGAQTNGGKLKDGHWFYCGRCCGHVADMYGPVSRG